MTTIEATDVRRHSRTILLGHGRTATEGMEGSLPTLRIRQDGKPRKFYRGSSLEFGHPLTAEDREYLASLGSD